MNAIRPWLIVGTRHDLRNVGLLSARGVTASLQLAEAVEVAGILSKHLPVEDGRRLPGSLIRDGLDFVLGEKEKGGSVLITCSGGFSRSVSFAVAALKEAEGLTLAEALGAVRLERPEAHPHPQLWASLCEYYQETDSTRPRRR